MKQLYIVIEKDESKSFSPIIVVCSELSIAYKHWCTYTEGSVEKEGNFRYEIVGLTLEDVDAVKKLGLILRLAECFDRTKNNVIIVLTWRRGK